RENAGRGAAGNTVSGLEVEKPIAGAPQAEVARVLVGTNNPAVATGTFSVAFPRDGRWIIASNFRSNNVSIVDVAKALANEPAEIARIPLSTPSGGPSRPRGIAITPDGRHALITGAARGASNSSVVWLLDLTSLKIVSRVPGVGNESYLLDILPAPRP